jgi:SpoVK/Ycf46/Vps4 family AAA+-type ATPase
VGADDTRVRALQEAVERSPDNHHLRAVLADALLEIGRADDAEHEYKSALKRAPGDDGLTLGLVRALCAQGRQQTALPILDAHVELSTPSGELLVEHARLLLAADRAEDAATQYRRAVTADPGLADPFLARRLKIRSPAGASAGGKVREADAESSGDEGSEPVEAERPKISFRDVGGMDTVKEQIRMKVIHPLENPELYKAYGKAIGGGILLYGPPGCGKTHVARATAGEVEATYLAVGIHDVLEMWIGQSERNLHAIFAQARRSKPAVLFFDEVDALGASRSDMRGAAGRHVINQFLAELDGVQSSNDGVLILAATNAPWHIDAAFRRPGRFDRVIFVPPPDLEARARILEILCLGRPAGDIDFEKVARRTQDYSGADLKAIVDLAIEDKLSDALRSGKPEPLDTPGLLAAHKRVKPSTGEWFSTARNYVLYSNEGGLYDDVRTYLGLGT